MYRCYRYGQQRNVFAYRFLTEGTIEEKVYSRAVNKSSLALSLVDGKAFQRVFTEEETADFSKTDDWVLCERCNKWRMFPPETIDVSTLPEKVRPFRLKYIYISFLVLLYSHQFPVFVLKWYCEVSYQIDAIY